MLSLVAYAVGYKMIVGAHNTINVRCMWRLRRLLLVWQTSVSAILLMPRDMRGVLPCSSGMGVVGAHKTVGQMWAPTILLVF